MLNRYYDQIATASKSRHTASYPSFLLDIDGNQRPIDATIMIGDEYVRETKLQHEYNVKAKLDEFTSLVAKSDERYLPETVGMFLIKLRNEYNSGQITFNTFKAVVGDSRPELCSDIMNGMEDRGILKNGKITMLDRINALSDPMLKLELLLMCGMDPNLPNSYGGTAIHTAAEADDAKYITLLAKYNVNLNAQVERNGYTALHIAAISKKPEAVAALLKAGAKDTILSKEGVAPIGYAVKDLATLKAFLDNGVDVHRVYGTRGYTALKYARYYQQNDKSVPDEVIRYLEGRELLKEPQKKSSFLISQSMRLIFEVWALFGIVVITTYILNRRFRSYIKYVFNMVFQEVDRIDYKIIHGKHRQEDTRFFNEALNYLTFGILEGQWKKINSTRFSIELKIASTSPVTDITLLMKPLKRILERRYGGARIENNYIFVDMPRVTEQIDCKADREDFVRELMELGKPKDKFVPYEKRLNALTMDELVVLRKQTLDEYERKVHDLELKVNGLHVEDSDRNKKSADRIKKCFAGIKEFEKEIKNIDYSKISTSLASAKEKFVELKRLPFDEVQLQLEVLIQKNNDQLATARKSLRNYASYLAERVSEIEKEFLKFPSPEKQQKKRVPAEKPQPAPVIVPPAPVLDTPRPVTPVAAVASVPPTLPDRSQEPVEADERHKLLTPVAVVPSKPVKTYEVPATLFAVADLVKSTPKLHAKAAIMYADNMSALLNNLSENTPDINLFGLLYNVIRLIQSLWNITAHREGDETLMRYITTMRNLVVHGATKQVGSLININHVIAAARRLTTAIPVLQDIAYKDNTEKSITEKTSKLIGELKLGSLELILLSRKPIPDLTPHDCLMQIREARNAILEISKKGFASVAEVEAHPHRSGAVKLLVVKIGEYWNEYCRLQSQEQEEGFIESVDVKTLNYCRLLRNRICHFTRENNDASCSDIGSAALLSLLSKLSGGPMRVAAVEEADQPEYVAARALLPPNRRS